MPIMRAAAVAAVRPVLRTEFPRASLPAAPPSCRAGQPTTAAIGRTRRDETIATPTKRRSTPPAIERRRSPVASSSLNIEKPRRKRARAIAPSATNGVKRAKRDLGRVAPSRTAAIGGTRVARIAGNRPATRVTITPTRSETTIVRVANTVSAWGRSRSSASKSRFRAQASPRPPNSPITDAMIPIVSASRMTEPSTCRREAPTVRSVANSRVRCATVIESVLKMTKAPTNSAMPAKASRK
jgi:hypothetical protein